jgi:hypothetical protein
MYKILILLLIPNSLFAQLFIKGRVLNITDKSPVADAIVFLSNSTIGNVTSVDGLYSLNNVRNGRYDLVISCIGYEPYHQDISVYNNNLLLPDILLIPKVTSLNEVKIKGGKTKRDPDRERYIRMFISEFFGHTKNAADCKLLNPNAINFIFDKSSEKLTANSSGFLILENRALGYRIKYLLVSFLIDPRAKIISYTGSSIFEQLDSTANQKIIWQRRRAATYLGSEMHFLRSCIANQVEASGFTVRKLTRVPVEGRPPDSLINTKITYFSNPSGLTSGFGDSLRYWVNKSKQPKYEQTLSNRPLDTYEYTKATKTKGIYAFGYPDCLMVNYLNSNKSSNNRSSFITFRDQYSYFDNNGIIFTPLSNSVEGYWGTLRIAELLPVDYELPNGSK